MDNLQKFVQQVRGRVLLVLLFNNLLIIADWWLADEVFKLGGIWLIATVFIAPILSLTILPWVSAKYLTQPTKLIWQAILHIAPDTSGVAAPDLKSSHIGQELVTNLISHVYQLASVASNIEKLTQTQSVNLKADFIANNLPLPLLVLNKDANILFANDALLKYITPGDEIIGQNVYSVLDMSFDSEDTFDAWLEQSRKNTVTATRHWERVRLSRNDQPELQFDLAAYYNKSNPEHIETLMVLFDKTTQYAQDDQSLSFVALAVHELRTPLTLMRGYIEVFDEELGGKLDGEMEGFMHKMNVAAQQLAAFVNNILNVARIESDQLSVHLQEEKWSDILQAAINDLQLRAQVRDITLECEPITADLPTVGVDRLTIYEVMSNLIDNAIKYSGNSKKIIIKTQLTNDGEVETTIQDFGVGIPESVVPNLFNKFYRNHRNRAQIGGTGLGLYLSKAIVSAHGGNIWVRSKEGEGSTFGFTILPYAKLADEQKNSDNKDIVHVAHGWIKNHSLYRR